MGRGWRRRERTPTGRGAETLVAKSLDFSDDGVLFLSPSCRPLFSALFVSVPAAVYLSVCLSVYLSVSLLSSPCLSDNGLIIGLRLSSLVPLASRSQGHRWLFFSLLHVPATCWSVSQGRICPGNCTYYRTETECEDQTCYLTKPHHTNTGPTSSRADPMTSGAWRVATVVPI